MAENEVVEKVEEKRGRGRPRNTLKKREAENLVKGIISQGRYNTTAEDNARYTENALAIANLPLVNLMDENQVRDRINTYFQMCVERNLKPNIAGISLSLHCDRQMLLDICNGKKKAPVEVVDVIKQARRILNELMETYQYDGKGNPVSMIFLSKNNFGYKDQSEVVVSNNDQFGEVQSAEDLRKKYLTDVIDDSIDV